MSSQVFYKSIEKIPRACPDSAMPMVDKPDKMLQYLRYISCLVLEEGTISDADFHIL